VGEGRHFVLLGLCVPGSGVLELFERQRLVSVKVPLFSAFVSSLVGKSNLVLPGRMSSTRWLLTDTGVGLFLWQATRPLWQPCCLPSRKRARACSNSSNVSVWSPSRFPCLVFRDVKRFRGGLVFKAHRLVHHSTLGWRVIKKKKITVWGLGFGV